LQVSLSNYHERGSAGVSALIEYGTLSTTATFRIWFPSHVSFSITDVALGLIVPAHSAGDPALGRGADLEAVQAAYADNSCKSYGGRFQQVWLK
jgi:hypothetical protein